MDSNRFNQILVVDSIPTGEVNTAKHLFEDLQTYASAYSPSPAVQYLRVESGDEFIQCIAECRKRANELDIIPMLHVECHGDDDGFQFADGSLADWDELKMPITDLNVATRLNLMIAVAACTGGALAKVVRISDRAPFWRLIAPTKILTAAELEKAYRALYLTLLSTKGSLNNNIYKMLDFSHAAGDARIRAHGFQGDDAGCGTALVEGAQHAQ